MLDMTSGFFWVWVPWKTKIKKKEKEKKKNKKDVPSRNQGQFVWFFFLFFAFIHSQREQKQEFIIYIFSHLQPSIFHGEYAKSLSAFESNIKKNKLAEPNLRRTQHMMFPGFCPLI